jgi:hypothetical protein
MIIFQSLMSNEKRKGNSISKMGGSLSASMAIHMMNLSDREMTQDTFASRRPQAFLFAIRDLTR